MIDTPQTFSFNGQKIRAAIIDGEAWFVAKEVCEAIGIDSYPEVLKCLDKDEKRLGMFPGTDHNCLAHLSFINENALFRLIFKCASKDAEKLAKWINSRVLPELHRECVNAHEEEAQKSRSILEEITLLQHSAKTAAMLLSLPFDISLNKATQILETYGFSCNSDINSD